jgi:hypothetical protein
MGLAFMLPFFISVLIESLVLYFFCFVYSGGQMYLLYRFSFCQNKYFPALLNFENQFVRWVQVLLLIFQKFSVRF